MRKRRMLFVSLGTIFTVVVAWFLFVDWSWFVESCPDCGSDWSRTYFRVFGMPISEKTYPNTMMLELVSADLGVSCTHPNLTRWHKHRWWGLCVCAYPCRNGIIGFAGDAAEYDDAMATRVKTLAEEDPKLGQEFRQRVLVEHDYDYWFAFVERLKTP